MCLYPTIHKNKKYQTNKKNGGEIPRLNDERVLYVPIKCGNCMECRKQKAREWQVRLQEDIKTDTYELNGKTIEKGKPKFITLTFSDKSIAEINQETITKTDKRTGEIYKIKISELEGYQKDNAIATKAVRLFNERWRKQYGKAIRHWLVTELGHNGTENIHLHGIIWTNEKIETIGKIWKYGYIWPKNEKEIRQNYVNAKTINYIIKYINKQDEKHKTYKSKILTSPGIGSNYTSSYNSRQNRYDDKETDETYRTTTGHKINMPIYWRNKIYSMEEREQLWLNKLDKQQRWICGEAINISKGEDEYYKLLDYYRKINKQLGYGTSKKDWNRAEYEHQRRNLLQATRIQKGNPSGEGF